MKQASLPRRDLWLMPLLSLATLVVLSVSAEVGAQIFYAQQPDNACQIADSSGVKHYEPNCTTTDKAAEGPWVTEHYNAYGFRAPQSWTPFPPGTRRIALIGTSFADGLFVRYEETAGATIGASLTSACHQPVEMLIAGSFGFTDRSLEQRLRDTLAFKPQVALFMFSARDLLQVGGSATEGVQQQLVQPIRLGLLPRVQKALGALRLVTVVQHFMVRNPSLYIPMYMRNGETSNFLRAGLTPSWKERVAAFDADLSRFDAMSKSVGTSLGLIYVPLEPQAVLASRANNPPDLDPFALGAAISEVAAKHNIAFHDATSDFSVLANPQDAYYAADGHPTGRGQTIIGVDAARQFLRDLPAFADCDPTRLAAASASGG